MKNSYLLYIIIINRIKILQHEVCIVKFSESINFDESKMKTIY